MKAFQFLNGIGVPEIRNFWNLDSDTPPALPGVYLLIAKPKMEFVYPGGKNPIFYIGHSKSLLRRLLEHLKYMKHVRDGKREKGVPLYWPCYEYGGVFGGRYSFIRTHRGLKSKSLEDRILAQFARRYHSFPVANGAGAWARIEHEFGRECT